MCELKRVAIAAVRFRFAAKGTAKRKTQSARTIDGMLKRQRLHAD